MGVSLKEGGTVIIEAVGPSAAVVAWLFPVVARIRLLVGVRVVCFWDWFRGGGQERDWGYGVWAVAMNRPEVADTRVGR